MEGLEEKKPGETVVRESDEEETDSTDSHIESEGGVSTERNLQPSLLAYNEVLVGTEKQTFFPTTSLATTYTSISERRDFGLPRPSSPPHQYVQLRGRSTPPPSPPPRNHGGGRSQSESPERQSQLVGVDAAKVGESTASLPPRVDEGVELSAAAASAAVGVVDAAAAAAQTRTTTRWD